MSEGNHRRDISWLYDDLLAWLSPGGSLLTALALRFPGGLSALRATAPELTLPTWFAGAYVLGLALSPIGRLAYSFAQFLVWPWLRSAWAPAIAFLGARLKQSEGHSVPDVSQMSAGEFHDLDRRMREYLEAADPSSRSVLNRMKVLCSLSCNTVAACVVFGLVDLAAGNRAQWTATQVVAWFLAFSMALVTAIYRERRRQRTQLSIWRRLQIPEGHSL